MVMPIADAILHESLRKNPDALNFIGKPKRQPQSLAVSRLLEGMEKKVEFLRSEGKRTGIKDYNTLADNLANKVDQLWTKKFYLNTPSKSGFGSVGVSTDWITLHGPFWDQLNDNERELTLIHELAHTNQGLLSRKLYNRFDSEAEAYKEELKHILLFGTGGTTTGGNTALDYLESKWRGPGGWLFDPYLKDRSPATIKKMLRDELGIPDAIIDANFDKNFGPILGTHFPDGRPLPDMSPEAKEARRTARAAQQAAATSAAAAAGTATTGASSGASGGATRIKVTPEQLRGVAGTFKTKSQQSEAMCQELRNQITGLQGDWAGITQQRFFNEFVSWSDTMTRFVGLLLNIALELEKVAQQIEQTDQQLSSGINVQF